MGVTFPFEGLCVISSLVYSASFTLICRAYFSYKRIVKRML